MGYTWESIKLATLQKMFSSNGTTIQSDSSTQEYINSMPQAANEALQLLATAGKFIIKSYTIVNHPEDNLLSSTFDTVSMYNETVAYSADAAHSYYFKIIGGCTLNIYVGDTLYSTLTIEQTSTQTAYKGLITNDDDETVTLEFIATTPAYVSNICLYEKVFYSDDDIPDYEAYLKFPLKTLIDDFYQIAENEIYFEEDGEGTYIAATDYYQEAYKTLVIPRSKEGVYTVYYKSYPTDITLDTDDDYELELDPEVAAIMPLYMASQLYKDDDNSIATVYRNEFEVAFDRLSQGAQVKRKEEFTSESGW